MSYDTGDIYVFSKYNHLRTGTIKGRHALILVSKELTDAFHGICSQCSQICRIYTSPLHYNSKPYNVNFPMPKAKYGFLDTDRHCNLTDSSIQLTCNQQHLQLGKIAKEDVATFIEALKTAFTSNNIAKELNDPFFRGLVIHQWDDLSK